VRYRCLSQFAIEHVRRVPPSPPVGREQSRSSGHQPLQDKEET
jgi:hypothetical protein